MQIIPFLFVFLSNGALFGDDVKTFVSGLIIMVISKMVRLPRWGLGVVQAIIYHCNAVPVGQVKLYFPVKRSVICSILHFRSVAGMNSFS